MGTFNFDDEEEDYDEDEGNEEIGIRNAHQHNKKSLTSLDI